MNTNLLPSWLGISNPAPAVDPLDEIVKAKQAPQPLGSPYTPSEPTVPTLAPAPAPQAKPGKQPDYAQQNSSMASAQNERLMAKAALEGAKNDYTAAENVRAATATVNQQRDIEDQRMQVTADVDRRQQEINAQRQDWAKQKIDVSGKDMPMGDKVGLAIQAFLLGMSHKDKKQGAAAAMTVINNAVQKYVAAQQADLERQGQGLDAQQRGLDTEYARGAQNADARLRATLQGHDMVSKMITSLASKYDTPIVQANAQLLAGNNDQQALKENQDYNDKQTSLGLQKSQVGQGWARIKQDKEQFQLNFDESKRRYDEGMKLEIQKAVDAGDLRKAAALSEEKKLAVPGVIDPKTGKEWVAATPDDAKEAKQSMRALSHINELLNERDRLRTQFDSETMPSQAKDRMRVLDRQLMLAIKDGEKTGTLDAGSVDFINDYIGDTARFSNIKGQSDELRRGLLAKSQAHFQSLGYTGMVKPFALNMPADGVSGTRKTIPGPPDEQAAERARQQLDMYEGVTY